MTWFTAGLKALLRQVLAECGKEIAHVERLHQRSSEVGAIDRAKYVSLAVLLYLAGVATLTGAVSEFLDRPYREVAMDFAPMLIICLIGVIHHALRHDLES